MGGNMQSGAAIEPKFSVGSVTRFYVPLLLQGFSQSLAYPLVAGIVTHGELGVDALTAFSQGQMVMFMIGAIGGGLVTTGLVFAKTWMGYVAFKRLNTLMMSALLTVQCVVALPPFSGVGKEPCSVSPGRPPRGVHADMAKTGTARHRSKIRTFPIHVFLITATRLNETELPRKRLLAFVAEPYGRVERNVAFAAA